MALIWDFSVPILYISMGAMRPYHSHTMGIVWGFFFTKYALQSHQKGLHKYHMVSIWD